MADTIGRRAWIALHGVDRGSAIEDNLMDAVHDLGEKHGVHASYISGPLFEDGDETDRELAQVKAERDRYHKALLMIREAVRAANLSDGSARAAVGAIASSVKELSDETIRRGQAVHEETKRG